MHVKDPAHGLRESERELTRVLYCEGPAAGFSVENDEDSGAFEQHVSSQEVLLSALSRWCHPDVDRADVLDVDRR